MATYAVTIADRYRQAVLSLAPTSYWPLTELSGTAAADEGSAGDDGVIVGTPTLGVESGVGSRAITFDGSDDRVTVAAATPTTATWSAVAWIKLATTYTDSYGTILANATGPVWFINNVDATDPLTQGLPMVFPNGNSGDGWTYGGSAAGQYITRAQWTHVAIVASGSTFRFFVNGVWTGGTSGVGDQTPETVTPTTVGAFSATSNRLKGDLSDVAYWAGTALTDAQIAALYAARTVEVRAQTLYLAESVNHRGTCVFQVPSATGSYRPALGSEVLVTEDGTRIWGGLVDEVKETGWANQGVVPVWHTVSAMSFQSYAERCPVTVSIPTGSLKSFLEALDDFLASYGVTLDAAQATGPTLDAASFTDEPLNSILDRLATISGYVWEIDAQKVLRMYLPGSLAAPFDVSTANGYALGEADVKVTRSRRAYANRVILRAGEAVVREQTETFTGDGVLDSWVLTYPLVGHRGYITVDGVMELLGTDTTWAFAAATNTITRAAPVANGDSIVIVYDAQFPISVVAEDTAEQAAHGLYQAIYSDPTLYDATVAQAVADAVLAQALLPATVVVYETAQLGLRPGMSQTLTFAERGVSGTYTIQDVETRNPVGNAIRRRVTAISGTNARPDLVWHQTLKQWSAGGSSAVTAIATMPVVLRPVEDLATQESHILRLSGQDSYTPSAGDTSALATTVFGPLYSFWRLTPTTARTIYGIYCADLVNGARGQVLVLVNDSDYAITFGTGLVTNARRIYLPGNAAELVLEAHGACVVVYDTANLGWRVIATAAGTASVIHHQISRTDAGTADVVEVEQIKRVSSGTPAAGFGTSRTTYLEIAGTPVEAFEIETKLNSVTGGAEQAKTTFKSLAQAALRDALVIGGDAMPEFSRYMAAGAHATPQASASFVTRKGLGTISDGFGAKMFLKAEDDSAVTMFLGGLGAEADFTNSRANLAFYVKAGVADTYAATIAMRLMYDLALRLYGTTSGYVGLKAAAAAGSTTYTLPAADGGSGSVLTTNGAGTLSWAASGSGGNIPVGGGCEFFGSVLPANYLWADGASYDTTTYATLFAVVGYTYGGAGANFNVPDKRDRQSLGKGTTYPTLGAVVGAATHAHSGAGLETSVPDVNEPVSMSGSTGGAGTHTHGIAAPTTADAQAGSGITVVTAIPASTDADDGAHTHGAGTLAGSATKTHKHTPPTSTAESNLFTSIVCNFIIRYQ